MLCKKQRTAFCYLYVFLGIAWHAAGRQEPIGLTNLGNTCFMNAMLQALLVTPYFQFLRNMPRTCQSVPLLLELLEFDNRYNKFRLSNPGDSYDTNPLYVALRDEYEIPLQTGAQQDAHEMLVKILEHIENEITQKSKASIGKTSENRCKSNPFLFQQQETFQCVAPITTESTCNYTWVKNLAEGGGRSDMLTAPPREGTKIIDVAEIINAWKTPEKLEDFTCEKCKQKGFVSRIAIKITALPEIFAVVVNIVQHTATLTGTGIRKKIIKGKEIDEIYPQYDSTEWRVKQCFVPSMIDFSSVCEPKVPPAAAQYYLVSMALHMGGTGSGHYVANVRYGRQWYACSDTEIRDDFTTPILLDSKVAWEESLPRILFYVRITPAEILNDFNEQLTLLAAISKAK